MFYIMFYMISTGRVLGNLRPSKMHPVMKCFYGKWDFTADSIAVWQKRGRLSSV